MAPSVEVSCPSYRSQMGPWSPQKAYFQRKERHSGLSIEDRKFTEGLKAQISVPAECDSELIPTHSTVVDIPFAVCAVCGVRGMQSYSDSR